jgi:anti-sigma B factor antagonist
MTGSTQFEYRIWWTESLLIARGEIDMAVSAAFKEAMQLLVEDGKTPALVDLSAVTFMDSAGVEALVSARRRAESDGISMVLVEPSQPVRRILQITGLLAEFDIRDGA